jgi:hypothetical protein
MAIRDVSDNCGSERRLLLKRFDGLSVRARPSNILLQVGVPQTKGGMGMTTEQWLDLIGWIGAVLLLTAYALVSTERWRGRSFRFQLCNALGSGCLIANTAYYGAYPSTAVNVVWVVIALYALGHATRVERTP